MAAFCAPVHDMITCITPAWMVLDSRIVAKSDDACTSWRLHGIVNADVEVAQPMKALLRSILDGWQSDLTVDGATYYRKH